ncbi:hypothetical protein ASD11_15245 [Aeromicrobium sp. Root495]|uniref:SGNH/GDSL hydrolase family protein n=1 Tax=Aeromicrobium sp. Root495 TaxID=1736550 RepID=UPI0006F70631|nr:SGNH/GDSL hydrolase family protein [Aeromicrobium sp. Root495]KQY55852.1 hypothetical protein ASD11_15245 [Aeromicrobium sp. Root495]
MKVALAALGVLALLLLAPADAPLLCRTVPDRTGGPTFASLMTPYATSPAPDVSASVSDTAPGWGPERDVLTRWDAPVFTHSVDPQPFGTLNATATANEPRPDIGAEYVTGNALFKNADVEFRMTGQVFAVRYLAVQATDAMVWIDGRPVADRPFETIDTTPTGSFRWLTVRLASPRTVTVRFAGPAVFTGVEHDRRDPVRLSEAPDRFTIGVVGDSYYESTIGDGWRSSAAPVELATQTGFRVRSLAQGGTGYLNDGTGPGLTGSFGLPGHYATPYGSSKRLAQVVDAPIDALLVNGSINDAPPFGAEQQRAAVDDFLDAVRRARPDLPIVLVGVEPVSYGGAPDVSLRPLLLLERNLRCAMRDRPQVRGVVEPYRENWLTGTGYVDGPRGDGNQDTYIGRDWIHPSAAGVAYYQRKVVAALRPMTTGPREP